MFKIIKMLIFTMHWRLHPAYLCKTITKFLDINLRIWEGDSLLIKKF